MSDTLVWYETPLEIRYVDTDQMGIVHHSVFACYCEIGRTRMLEELGTPYTVFETEHYFMMVAEMYNRFMAPLRYGEKITMRTAITRLNRRFVAFSYQILGDHPDDIRFTGTTSHVVTNEAGKPTSLSKRFVDVLQKACYPAK